MVFPWLQATLGLVSEHTVARYHETLRHPRAPVTMNGGSRAQNTE